MRYRRLLPLAATAALAIAVAMPAVAQAGTRTTTCPGTFRVLHNDHIGAMSLPAGPYVIRTTGGMSCSEASRRFTEFLLDYDGVLPRPWRMVVSQRAFFRGNTNYGFSVTPSNNGGGGGGGGGGSLDCNGTFQVLHNDRIGRLSLPAGPYRITLVRSRGRSISCTQAARLFAQFLEYPSGNLPRPWRLNASTRTFTNSAGVGFRVTRVGGGGGGGGGTGGSNCPGTFQVLHNDRIGALVLPRGPYVISVKEMSCSSAASFFRQFLNLPSGNLPRPWRLNAETGTFTRGSSSFSVKPAR